MARELERRGSTGFSPCAPWRANTKRGSAVPGRLRSSALARLMLDPWLWMIAIGLVGFTLRAHAGEIGQSCDSPPIVAPSVEPIAVPECDTDDEGDE